MKTRHYVFLSLVGLVLLLLFFVGKCRGQEKRVETVAETVAFVLKTYGGERALEKVSTVTAKGKIVDFMNGTEGRYMRYFERPRKLRIEIMPGKGGEERILNGDRGWQAGPTGYVEVAPIMLQSMVYQYSYLDLPMGLAHGAYPVSYGGRQKLGNREVQVLLIDLKGAPRLRVAVDSETHLITRVSADFAMGMMGASELATEYHDFRPTAGILFPHRLVNYAGETKLSEITLSDIVVNSAIPEKVFTPVPFSSR